MTALLEKRIIEQFTANPATLSKMTPGELEQMLQRIAGTVETFTGAKLSWELPSSSDRFTQQEQLDTLVALYLGA
ncbi:hypothetical protein GCM10028803_35500 [Larkinella knui]|uniref:Uncharacterized protein n=1 Tax=Larkinella knui TaxID=2025310 RepID=A0A3P1CDN6_9BACT|nr:hypothetical protein [Larkinella knui]RRB11422.1 hypothetical protein EHT87_23340 [Larkinella knui]